jgi:isoleucyl-tRNA synthetase
MPAVDSDLLDDTLAAKWDSLLEARTVVTKALEEARKQDIIGHSLDARVRLRAAGQLWQLLAEQEGLLPALLIVSQVELLTSSDGATKAGVDGLSVEVEPARGEKCNRCWNYREDVGQSMQHPTLCGRCVSAVETSHPAEG